MKEKFFATIFLQIVQTARDRLKPGLLLLATLSTAIGVGYGVGALVSPKWEIIYLREYQTEHEHGLWSDCARTAKSSIVNGKTVTIYGKTHCTYKFDFMINNKAPVLDESAPKEENATHIQFEAWQIVYMSMITAAILCGTGTILISISAFRNLSKVAPILIFTITSLLSASLQTAVFVSYYTMNLLAEYRWIRGVTSVYEPDDGAAYYWQLYSVFAFMIAFVIGMILLKYFPKLADASRKNSTGQESTANLKLGKKLSEYFLSTSLYRRKYPDNQGSQLSLPFFNFLRKSTSTDVSRKEPTEQEMTTYLIADNKRCEYFLPTMHYPQLYPGNQGIDISAPFFSYVRKSADMDVRRNEPGDQESTHYVTPDCEQNDHLLSYSQLYPNDQGSRISSPLYLSKATSIVSTLFDSQKNYSFEPETVSRSRNISNQSQTPLLLGLETIV